jgi:hypothetical protein
MQSYLSSVVGIDTQSIVHGRPQQTALIESHTSMMSSRQLLAPKPPGSQLIDASTRNRFDPTAKSSDSDLVAVADLSPSQQYELRRQSRKRMYHKERESFFNKGIHDSSPAELLPCLSRSPSRYLQALLKHEPDRQRAAMMLYPDAFTERNPGSATERDEDLAEDSCSSPGSPNERKDAISLNDLVEPLTRLACVTRARYAYQDAELTQDARCGVCRDNLKL